MNISKIRTNSHELLSENGCWFIPTTPWDENVCHFCDTKWIEDEKNFPLDFPTIMHMCSNFQIIATLPNFFDLLIWQNYRNLRMFLSLQS